MALARLLHGYHTQVEVHDLKEAEDEAKKHDGAR
jgi:hypothetical protein